jgi:glycosyltransferase involved in cell wall biosynthesis
MRRNGKPAARVDPDVETPEEMHSSKLEPRELASCCNSLADQLAQQVARHRITALHAIGLDFPATVAQLLHKRTGIPYYVTPRGSELVGREDPRFQTRARAALLDAHQVITFDEETRRGLETRFDTRQGELKLRVLRRGIDLETFKPLPRRERAELGRKLMNRSGLRTRLEGIDWAHRFLIVAVEPRGDRHGFEQFLFAMPELLRLQPALQVIVVGNGEHPVTDGLRAAMAAGRPELLHDVVTTSELCQPLVDHLERLHQEGRAESWWSMAARIEPERRVRFVGWVGRSNFTALLRLSDLFVLPGITVRPPSQMFFEALACGVMPLANELSGITSIVRLIGEEISAEIASLCLLRIGVQPVREIEDKIGRIVRLRPELTDRLRALAVAQYDGQRVAADLRRVYEQSASAATTRP